MLSFIKKNLFSCFFEMSVSLKQMNLPLNEVYSEVKICLNFPGITSRIVLLFLESSKQFSHYYGFGNYIYVSYILTARHLG